MSIVIPGIGAVAGALGGSTVIPVLGYDASSTRAVTAGNASWTHTPVAAPQGILLFLSLSNATTSASAVTYGGVAMSRVSGAPLQKATGEPGGVDVWLLSGPGIPTGAQTVSVTISGAGNWLPSCFSLTSTGAGVAIQDTTTISTDSVLNPSGTLSLGGVQCFCAMGFMTGLGAINFFDPITNWTSVFENDQGAFGLGSYRYNIVGTADVTFGYSHNAGDPADDAVIFAVAVKAT
jgi:hypothetical protein